MKTTEFWVDRRDLANTRIEVGERTCGDGEVVLEIERFALTANNVTYAVGGEAWGYWKFFPAAEGWGRVPVWGFARVAQTKCAELRTGERFFGYLPMGTHLLVRPGRVGVSGFIDGAPHRATLPAVYNQYLRAGPPDPRADAAQMLLRPLFMTSFLIDDFLADNDFYGARGVILSSASSKTALGVAFELARRRSERVEVLGLTSPANVEFVLNTGYYDRVIAYDALETLDSRQPSVFVDVAGDASVLRRVHEHFRDNLRHSCLVGATHWRAAGGGTTNLPGPEPTVFFAPTRIQKRNQDWGAGALERNLAGEWTAFVADAMKWMEVVDVRGVEAMRRCYTDLLAGRAPASQGFVVSPDG